MKNVFFICCCLLVWVPSCKHEGADYYKEIYQKNKQKFLFIQSNLQPLLKGNDSVFKIHFEVTGKRTFATFYENDSTFANAIPIPKNVEFRMSDFMYKIDLNYAVVYRDSIKYVFSGRYKDVIVNYTSPQKGNNGVKIDTNTYVVLDNK